ncbi:MULTISPECIES: ABC transporter ATP-binding protein [Treponema]|uniref:ABC transporter related protein n=2 Tax=Treponema saccharophilum TaxID=165 RepID=H7EIU3_9SPIR|nr:MULTISPECIES: ABC transporter ATP-binding protein [Treponema]EIC02521.1 ABC transporter related protein [Treponema saccharophilum DSM 2985]MBQ5537072.1 ABC transporter ATP-binding protein [Treponema sp.]BDC96896.1 ABC transporter ATP-binding protein [Treponema saccharophilum]
MNLVELKGISKTYTMDKVQVRAVDDASISIEKGEFAAISGPSGSGKSTLLNIIGLTDLPCAGSLILNGIDVYSGTDLTAGKVPLALDRKLTELRRTQLAFIFQSFNLIPVLNVRENVEFPLTLGKNSFPKSEEKDWIDFLLEKVGLSDRAKHKPSELSGGQRQRVAIARALVTKAPLILADEPTANLDSKNGEQILALMKKLNEELGTTFVFSTHDKKIVEMANHVIKIADGKIIEG